MFEIRIFLTVLSIILGLTSASSWFYASKVKVDHKTAMAMRLKEANKKGEKPNFASVSLDGWDMSATFAAQSKWNAFGALFAAGSILLHTLSQLITNV